MIYEKIDLLTKDLKERLANDEVVELRQTFLALTTDTLSQHAFEKSTNLLENSKAAADWKRTIKAVAVLTPLVKQFNWIIPLALKLPLTPLRWLLPDLARIVALRKVGEIVLIVFFACSKISLLLTVTWNRIFTTEPRRPLKILTLISLCKYPQNLK